MGSLQAAEFANAIQDGQIALDAALEWHLRANHYPPVPHCMISVCREAIEQARLGHYDTMLDLPDGVSYQGLTATTVEAVVTGLHLDAFIYDDDDEDYSDELFDELCIDCGLPADEGTCGACRYV